MMTGGDNMMIETGDTIQEKRQSEVYVSGHPSAAAETERSDRLNQRS